MMLLELIYKIGYKLRRGKIIVFMDRKNLIRYMLQDKRNLHNTPKTVVQLKVDMIK